MGARTRKLLGRKEVVFFLWAVVTVSVAAALMAVWVAPTRSEWDGISAKMREEAYRLEEDFRRCFENLRASDLENLADNQIQQTLEAMMPRQENIGENFCAVVVNTVGVRVVDNYRLVRAEMQYAIWHQKYPDYEVRGKAENGDVAVLPMVE
jgi:hypothetical protein